MPPDNTIYVPYPLQLVPIKLSFIQFFIVPFICPAIPPEYACFSDIAVTKPSFAESVMAGKRAREMDEEAQREFDEANKKGEDIWL